MARGRIVAVMVLALAAAVLEGQNPPAPPAQHRAQPKAKSAPNPAAALQFLGAYSAPAAIRSSETGHTSAAPPAPDAARRLREMAGQEASAAHPWREISRRLPRATTPEDWFRVGVLALAAARRDSRALARDGGNGPWNRRLTAAAVAASRGPGGPAGAAAPEELWRRLEALRRQPATPHNLYRRVRAAEALGDAAFARAARAPKLAARVDGLRALAAAQADQVAAAAADYRAGLALDPGNAALHAGLGALLRNQRRYAAAEPELAAACRLNPRDAIARFELADANFHLGHIHRALREANGALALAPTMLVARWLRGQIEARLGQDRAALADYLAAQGADTTGELQYQLGRLYLRLGDRQRAAAAMAQSRRQRAAARLHRS